MRINLFQYALKTAKRPYSPEFILLALLMIAIEGYFIISYILVPAYDSYVSATDDLAMRKRCLQSSSGILSAKVRWKRK